MRATRQTSLATAYPPSPRPFRGFTLVELMIALLLLAGGAAALLQLQFQAVATEEDSTATLQAGWLARSCMSRLLHAPDAAARERNLCHAPEGWLLETDCDSAGCSLRIQQPDDHRTLRIRLHLPLPPASS